MGLSQSAPRTCQWLHRMALPQGHTSSPSWTSQMYSRGFGFWVRSRETQGQRDFGVLTNGEFRVVHEANYGRFSPFQSRLLLSFNPLGPSTHSQ